MKFVVIASRKDIAGLNICNFLKDLPVYYTDKEIIFADKIDKNIDADFIIFASKHKGTKEKILTVHAPGNWKKADLGGKQGKICKTSGTVIKTIFREIKENLPEGWQLTLECTHHGPYIEKPCLFIEIGSNEKDWQVKEAGKAIAKTIENSIKLVNENKEKEKWKTAIGIGGPHYCPNFTKIQLYSDIAISHIIPQYVFPLTENMLKEAIEKTQEKIELVLLDWKGMNSGERQEVVKLLDKLKLKYKKTSEISKT